MLRIGLITLFAIGAVIGVSAILWLVLANALGVPIYISNDYFAMFPVDSKTDFSTPATVYMESWVLGVMVLVVGFSFVLGFMLGEKAGISHSRRPHSADTDA
jgi:hypothetical protein